MQLVDSAGFSSLDAQVSGPSVLVADKSLTGLSPVLDTGMVRLLGVPLGSTALPGLPARLPATVGVPVVRTQAQASDNVLSTAGEVPPVVSTGSPFVPEVPPVGVMLPEALPLLCVPAPTRPVTKSRPVDVALPPSDVVPLTVIGTDWSPAAGV